MTAPTTLFGAQPRRSRRRVRPCWIVPIMPRFRLQPLNRMSTPQIPFVFPFFPVPWTSRGHNGINPQPAGPIMKTFLLRFFTWWNGQTFGTQVWTALYGELVGTDEFGNRYYRTKGGKIDKALGFERRWVI